MKIKNWQISVTLVCVVLGLLLAVQLRTQSAKNLLPPANSEFMVRLYKAAEVQEVSLEREAEALRAELRKAAQGKSVLVGMNTELQKAKLLAGTDEVQGPGIVVTLDSPRTGPRGPENEELFLIHDEDLLNVMNELLATGAEAMSVNGERRTARTEIRRAGGALSVNNRTIGEPFVIKAIGNPEALERALEVRGGVIDALRAWGITVTISQSELLTIPAYKGEMKFSHGQAPSGSEAGRSTEEGQL